MAFAKKEKVAITAPNIHTAKFRIIGTAPLVQNKFSQRVLETGHGPSGWTFSIPTTVVRLEHGAANTRLELQPQGPAQIHSEEA